METTKFQTVEQIYSDIKENILNMDSYSVMVLHNKCCTNIRYYDDIIFENDPNTINELFNTSFDALKSMFYGDYNPHHEFFTFNGNGNLQSIADYNVMDYINMHEIISDIINNPYSYVDYINFLTDEYIENIKALKQD